MAVTGNNAAASMMLGLAMDRLYKFFAPALHKGLPQSEAPVFEGVFLLHQECDWLAQSLDACRARAYEVGRVKIRVPHYEERPGAAHSRRDQDCDASEVHKIEDEAQVLVVGHKPAMEVCEEQLSNTVPSSPIRQDRNCCQLHHGGVRVGGVAEALRARWLPYWMTTSFSLELFKGNSTLVPSPFLTQVQQSTTESAR